MQQLKTKRVGIYVRVSTEMQSTEGYSIDGQINQIKEYCDFHHFEVKDIYADRGISGKSMNRPELQRILKDAKDGYIDCVMVYKTNRLARNTSDLLKLSKIYTNKMSNFSVCQSVWKSILLLVNSCYKYLRVSQNSNVITLSRMYLWVKRDVPRRLLSR
ncbi:site-specific recombinase [Staphylococcus aureus]|uniref:Site-specific recombinase n=1 Tax=Staphylococcus aureus TaxID=1280 RepID=A0A380ECS0_STAAU|nr:site-specific recombinase [Staphylococcus aureus]